LSLIKAVDMAQAKRAVIAVGGGRDLVMRELQGQGRSGGCIVHNFTKQLLSVSNRYPTWITSGHRDRRQNAQKLKCSKRTRRPASLPDAEMLAILRRGHGPISATVAFRSRRRLTTLSSPAHCSGLFGGEND
jgi:hypothetical protein